MLNFQYMKYTTNKLLDIVVMVYIFQILFLELGFRSTHFRKYIGFPGLHSTIVVLCYTYYWLNESKGKNIQNGANSFSFGFYSLYRSEPITKSIGFTKFTDKIFI